MNTRVKLFLIFLFLLGIATIRFWPSPVVKSQTGLGAPTGVTASKLMYNNKVRLDWDAIRGATVYRIFRNTTNETTTAADVGSTPANSFLDLSAVPGQNYFYWVRAENGIVLSNFSQSDQGQRAVATQQGGVAPLEAPAVPPANPITAAKTYLGKALFWDEQLSSTKTVACGTCHHSGSGGTDPRTAINLSPSTNPGPDGTFGNADDIIGSRGVPQNNVDGTYTWSNMFRFNEQVTGRNSISFLNAGYSGTLFWDGRANGVFRDPLTNNIVINGGAALESQVLGPPLSSAEMAHAGRNWVDVASRVASSKPLALSHEVPTPLRTWINGRTYPELFQEAFGTPEVTPVRIALAIATYERTLYTDQTPFDLANGGISPLTAPEQRGRNLFIQIDCSDCHTGTLTSNNAFRYIGLRPQNDDTGRFQVTGNNNDLGRFRVPNLRNVELRRSFMHNGRFATLEEVVEFYNRGGDFDAPNKDINVRPRNLTTQQKADLVAFLKRPLTDPRVAAELPPFDRPKLYTESNRVPQVTGTGVAGSGGLVPNVTAIEPPAVGNPSFTVAVSNAIGGANTVLVIDSTEPGTGSIPATGSLARVNVQLGGSGNGNGVGSVRLAIPNNPALIGQTFFGRWYVTDAGAANGFSVSPVFRFTVFGEATAAARTKRTDFDGDGRTDLSVFRPTERNWYILRSSNNGFSATNFGLTTDILTPEDFDGDGKTDIAVFRNGTWYLLRSQFGLATIPFGQAGDKPQAGDYDGDGTADLAVYRNGMWYLQQSRDGFAVKQFGLETDRPVAADYDGDGKTDIAVYRNGTWYLQRSRDGFTATQFGLADDRPVFGDYDGDGKADIAVWRPNTSVWYVLRSTNGSFSATQYGISSDAPSPGDYDGDGKFDLAVFRQTEGYWYVLQSSTNAQRVQSFGTNQDVSLPSTFVP